MEQKGNLILDFLLLLLKRKRLIMGIVFLTSLMTAVYSMVMDKTWESRALIVPPGDSGGGLAGLLGDLPMAGMLGGLGGDAAGGQYYIAIFNSRVMRDQVIEQFDLRKHYEFDSNVEIEDVYEVLASNISIKLDYDSGMISLVVQDKDPQMAFDIAEFMIKELERLNRIYSSRKARENRRFTQGQVDNIYLATDSLETIMLEFQDREHLLEPDQQAQVILKSYMELKALYEVKDLELELARQKYGAGHPNIVMLEKEKRGLKRRLDSAYNDGEEGLFLAIRDLPKATIEFLKIKRELEIESQKLLFMLPQLEQAKLQEVRDTDVLEVLDPPKLPEKRVKPKRSLMVLLSAVLSFVVGSLLVLVIHRVEEDQDLARQLEEIGSHLRDLLRLKL